MKIQKNEGLPEWSEKVAQHILSCMIAVLLCFVFM